MGVDYKILGDFCVRFLLEYGVKDKPIFLDELKRLNLYINETILPSPGEFSLPNHYIYLQGKSTTATVMINRIKSVNKHDIVKDVKNLEILLNSDISTERLLKAIPKDKGIIFEINSFSLDMFYINSLDEIKKEFNRIYLRF